MSITFIDLQKMIFISTFLTGCAVFTWDASNDHVSKDLVGNCFSFQQPMVVTKWWRSKQETHDPADYNVEIAGSSQCAPLTKNDPLPKPRQEDWVGSFFSLAIGSPESSCVFKPIEWLSLGARFKVTNVMNTANGESGRFWVIYATFLDGSLANTNFEIWDAQESFLSSTSARPYPEDQNHTIKFNDSYAKVCLKNH
jgi:hypothetical protein